MRAGNLDVDAARAALEDAERELDAARKGLARRTKR